MTLVKTKKRSLPAIGRTMFEDPFFTDFLDIRKKPFQLNRLFNGDHDDIEVSPAVNIKDNKNKYEIELAAPGLSKDDFNITLEEGLLTISAEKKIEHEEEKEGYVKKEFSYSTFSRCMTLPETVDEDKDVKASYKDGILHLTLQKKEALKMKPAKKVKVS
jgi:HSP20 family protein